MKRYTNLENNHKREIYNFVDQFIHEYFLIEKSEFIARDEARVLGNRRYGWLHHRFGPLEVAFLITPVDRFRHEWEQIETWSKVGVKGTYMEIMAGHFRITSHVSIHYKMAYPNDRKRIPYLHFTNMTFQGDEESVPGVFAFVKLAK